MNRWATGDEHLVTLTPPADAPPVRVAVADECELVTRGIHAMLAPYSARVELLAPDRSGTADLTLHDSLASPAGPLGTPVLPSSYAGSLVVWTWNHRPGLVELALAHGARGCLSKDLPARSLVAALEAIHRGEVLVDGGAQEPARSRPSVLLTPRERDVVTLITLGLDNVGVARETGVSINSVKTYIRTAYQKMGVTSRSQAVLWGVRHGYLDESGPESWATGALTG